MDDLLDELINNIIEANSENCLMGLAEKYDNDIYPLAKRISILRKGKLEKALDEIAEIDSTLL